MTNLDQLNADLGNLDYADTLDLIKILDELDGNEINKAKHLLDEFIVRRGYDETLMEGLKNAN